MHTMNIYSEYDIEALECLLQPIRGLMQDEIENRMCIHNPADCTGWINHGSGANNDG